MDDLLKEMDAAGVSRAVIVPPSWEGDRNDLGSAAASLHPDRFAIAGRLDFELPSARSALMSWRDTPGMKAVRVGFHTGHFRDVLERNVVDWLWVEAEAAEIPVMLTVYTEQLVIVDRIARRHPGLKIALDHLCMPRGSKDDAAFAGIEDILAIAQRPNVSIKLTSLPLHTTDVYPYRKLHTHLRRIHEAFGAQRMFWGSDLTKLPCTYKQAVTMFTEEMPWLSTHDLEWIMGRSLSTWLQWPL